MRTVKVRRYLYFGLTVDALAQALAEKLSALQIGTTEKKPTDDITSVGLEEKLIIDQLF